MHTLQKNTEDIRVPEQRHSIPLADLGPARQRQQRGVLLPAGGPDQDRLWDRGGVAGVVQPAALLRPGVFEVKKSKGLCAQKSGPQPFQITFRNQVLNFHPNPFYSVDQFADAPFFFGISSPQSA